MPRIIDGGQETKSYKCVLWFGILLNGLFPLFELVAGCLWVYFEMDVRANNPTVDILLDAAVLGTFASQIISGCVLIWAVCSIWSYLKQSDNETELANLRVLVLHSTAFGLFLMSVIAMSVFSAWYYVDQYNANVEKRYLICLIVEMICSFMSQFLLCVIFWVLSYRDENRGTFTSSNVSLEVADYDQDDELQARIWN